MSDESREEGIVGIDGVAIVGMAGRFPGAPDIDAFWRNLCAGVESIRFYSDEELLQAGVAPEQLADPAYVKANAALEGVELFDAAFFGINPSIAQITDPQQRIFLELAWHALEHAGHDADRFAGDIGVFAGLSINTYLLENLASNRTLIESHGLLQAAMANRGDHLATLTAYKLNLRGPAFGVQSTCSTSLSAVHLACQALLSCQTDMALAGGVAVRVPQTMGYLFQEGGVASPDGHCRPFDASARGTVFGSGAGVVVLRRLEDALADGDTIYAVIRGSAANNDGGVKTGYTAPSSAGQKRAIRMALAMAGVPSETIGYVECHGTGTVLGDPIEVEALTQAFGAKTRAATCALGSVKANIGHLDTAAGIAGLIKTVLCLVHRQIPPTLHFERPNPHIDFDASPFYVHATLRDWPAHEHHPRRAGVSSFGIGGTNVHLVLEEAPAAARAPVADRWRTLILSARSASALEEQTAALRTHLSSHPELAFDEVVSTLQIGRKPFEHRRAVIARSREEAMALLAKLPPESTFTGRHAGGDRPVAFLFPGAGSQRPGMARELYGEVPRFRVHLDEALGAFGDAAGPLEAMLLSSDSADSGAADPGAKESSPSVRIAEAALFALEYALARTWMDWGVEARAVLGEGIGEYVALCIAGALPLRDTAQLVITRGRLLEQLPMGAMAVVMMPEPSLRALIEGRALSLAMVGRPSVCVVSGGPDAMDELERTLRARRIGVRRLACDRALQSPAVDAILPELGAAVRAMTFRPPSIPIFSGVNGDGLDPANIDWAQHLSQQLRRELRLSNAMAALYREPERICLVVGPGRALLNMARLHPAKAPEHVVLASLATSDPSAGEARSLATALGRLWLSGAAVNWAPQADGQSRKRIALPPYPFERQRLWLDRKETRSNERTPPPRKTDLADWFYAPSWRQAPLPVRSEARESLLLFADAFGLGELLAEELTSRGHALVRVGRGSSFQALADDRYAIDPARASDYVALLRDLQSRGRSFSRIVHLWSTSSERRGGSRIEALDRAERAGFRSLISLARAIGSTMPAKPLAIDVVTSQVHAVLGDEPIAPEKATVLGPLLVMGQEYPSLRCRNIDIVLPLPGSDDEMALVRSLVGEIESEAADALVAYRGRRAGKQGRWVRGFEPVRLPSNERTRVVRAGGTYLITGGLGGIGLELAGELARAEKVKLALLGRRAPSAHAQGRIAEWERLGCEVLVVHADVSDRAALAGALSEVRERFGAIHGLVHAAGVPAGGVIQLKTEEIAERVLAPKTRGTLLLDELLGQEPLDFAVYCGSRTALLGGFGQSDYVAANAFLDAFAQEKSRRSATAVVTIDWCGWKDVGMLADAVARRTPQATTYEQPLAEDRASNGGHPLLERCITRSPERIVYETSLRVDTHWVLADHRIHGNPVIAGTTYLEMVRAAFDESLRDRHLELSDIYFLKPLTVRGLERKIVRLELKIAPEGWTFEVSSRSAQGACSEQTHVMGKARLLPAGPDRVHDLRELAARCERRTKLLTDEDAFDEDHGPRWQCVKEVRWGEDEILATMELPSEFASDLERMKLHPSMLDKSIGTGRDFILGEVPYMPYSYKRVTFQHPLTRRIHVHTRAKSEASKISETPAFNLLLVDDAGRELVRIEEFALKRVNDIGAIYRTLASQTAAAPSPAGSEPPPVHQDVLARLMREEGIAPAEGANAFLRILQHGAMPQVVVSTRDMNALQAHGMLHTAPARTENDDEAIVVQANRPMRSRPELTIPFAAPEGEVQETVATIWREALSLDRVGVRDNFFELGGDSVLAIQIIARIKKATGRDLEVVHLFQSPTIEALARSLNVDPEASTSNEDSADRGARRRARAVARRQRTTE